MNNVISFSILLVIALAAVSGCEDTQLHSPATTTELVPGELEVQFADHIGITEAESFLQEISLRPIKLSNLEDQTVINWAVVGVPEGLERYWVKQLLHYPFVLSANQKFRTVRIE